MVDRSVGVEPLPTREQRVLRALSVAGATSRSQLCRDLGISRTAMSVVTGDLLRRGAIVVVDTDAEARTGSGRPAELLALDPAAGQYIGIDFRHRDARIVVADASQKVIAKGAVHYADEVPWVRRVRLVQAEIRRLMEATGVHLGMLQQIGIGAPGPVLLGMLRADEWPRTQPQAIADAFEAAYQVPVLLDNNVRLAALGEASAHGAGCRNLLFLRIGIGVGAGLVIDGHLAVGSRRLAGEFGHTPVAGYDAPCRCGRRGCLETVAAVPAVLRACSEAGLAVATADDLGSHAGDPRLAAVLDPVVTALVDVLTPVMLASDPDEIVLAGELFGALPSLVDDIGSRLRRRHFLGEADAPQVRRDVLGVDGGAMGALNALFRSSQVLVGYVPARSTHTGGN